jgi:CHASE3 domain sensor protein
MLKQLLSSIYSWIAIVIVVIAVMTTNSFYVLNTLNDLSSLEAKLFTTNRVISVINRLHVAVLRVESGQRGYMLTDNQKYLSDYTETLNTLNTLINDVEVSAYSSGIDEQHQRIDSLLFLTRQKVNKVIEAVELLKMDRRDEAFAILNSDEGFTLYSQFDALFTKIDESERELQGTHLANLMALRRDAVNTLIISSVTTLLRKISSRSRGDKSRFRVANCSANTRIEYLL